MCTLEKLGKALLGVVQILNIMGTISSRPLSEQSCERLAWGTIPNEEKNPNIRQIYPNENAPSDHPPYVVSFTYGYIGDGCKHVIGGKLCRMSCDVCPDHQINLCGHDYNSTSCRGCACQEHKALNISAMSTIGKKNVIKGARSIALGVIPRSGFTI